MVGSGMSENIVKLYPANSAEKADNVLEQAAGEYDQLLILGWDKDGILDARATLGLKFGEMLVLMEMFKANMIAGDYTDDEE